jgi:hypothetical protein
VNVTGITSLLAVPDSSYFNEAREGFFGRLAGGKAYPDQDRAKAASSRRVQLFSLVFQSRKDDACPESSQPGKAM